MTLKCRGMSWLRPPAEERGLFDILEGDVVTSGERTYAGMRCTAAHSPQWGARSEVCVANINGWPTALYLQLLSADLGWYRATRITRACASAVESRVPAGVAVEELDTSSNDDTDDPQDDAEE